jgi:thiosulfate/3-mercaptopyruvate sulfurtransferase
MAFDTLISAYELLALVRHGKAPVLIECSFDLFDADAGERAWGAGHPDGAHYLHLDRDLAGPKTGTNGRHPLPERAAFARTLARCGITPQLQVVAFDRQGGVYAARLWWMLRWMGHADAAVLDGGVDAWLAAGGTLSTTQSSPARTEPYPDRKPLATTCSALELAQSIGRVHLIDARAPERFRGEVEPLDAQAGHIPGALNRFFRENLAPGGQFKPAPELRAALLPLLAGHDAEQVVHQCGSGVTACHNLLAMEVAGLTGSSLYPGSWSEWSADPARPVARG